MCCMFLSDKKSVGKNREKHRKSDSHKKNECTRKLKYAMIEIILISCEWCCEIHFFESIVAIYNSSIYAGDIYTGDILILNHSSCVCHNL